MNCLKCGREISETAVFCEDCLLDMEKYPVKPGTVIQLPKRRENPPLRRTSKRRTVSAEEQLRTLRKRLRICVLLLLAAIALVVALAVPAVQHLMENRFRPGQNYSTFQTATTPAESTQDATETTVG